MPRNLLHLDAALALAMQRHQLGTPDDLKSCPRILLGLAVTLTSCQQNDCTQLQPVDLAGLPDWILSW